MDRGVYYGPDLPEDPNPPKPRKPRLPKAVLEEMRANREAAKRLREQLDENFRLGLTCWHGFLNGKCPAGCTVVTVEDIPF